MADQFLIEHDYGCSVILPQDIPLIFPQDLDTLFAYYQTKKRAIITPSRHFDGTNALLRMSSPSIKTRYDEGSYKYQFEPLKNAQINYSIALIHRIMIDLDNIIDVKHMLKLNIKPSFCSKLETIFSDSN